MEPKATGLYSKLAQLYDTLMGDVDYESWADYIDEIMQTHHPDPFDVMEAACGTGSVILSLAELECYRLTGTDMSEEMVQVARQKAEDMEYNVPFEAYAFKDLPYQNQFDCVYSVFDSINYLHSENEILKSLEAIHRSLKPGGLFIFDFSTPKNSLESVDYLNEAEGERGNIRFFRKSWYQPDDKIHVNDFEIEELDPSTKKVISMWNETHRQRAYTLSEMLSILDQTSYHLVAKYDGFDLVEANENSARVTIVLRCQKTQ
ncbi:MAG: class I SAM-dependent methyltransferase [Balneolaceae bacterium]|nr:class I SAM-dependent methyltransferase [Balneolaceae bacterium]